MALHPPPPGPVAHLVEQDHQPQQALNGTDARPSELLDRSLELGWRGAMAMLTWRQVRPTPMNDLPAQQAFVHQAFGLAA